VFFFLFFIEKEFDKRLTSTKMFQFYLNKSFFLESLIFESWPFMITAMCSCLLIFRIFTESEILILQLIAGVLWFSILLYIKLRSSLLSIQDLITSNVLVHRVRAEVIEQHLYRIFGVTIKLETPFETFSFFGTPKRTSSFYRDFTLTYREYGKKILKVSVGAVISSVVVIFFPRYDAEISQNNILTLERLNSLNCEIETLRSYLTQKRFLLEPALAESLDETVQILLDSSIRLIIKGHKSDKPFFRVFEGALDVNYAFLQESNQIKQQFDLVKAEIHQRVAGIEPTSWGAVLDIFSVVTLV
jgi:hypothetical protein